MSNKEEEVLEALRVATREARECLKDFKTVIKEYNSLMDGWKEEVRTRINTEIKEGLKNYLEVQKVANEEATAAIIAKFEHLYQLLMTGTKRKKTEPSIEDLIVQRYEAENKVTNVTFIEVEDSDSMTDIITKIAKEKNSGN